MKQWYEYQINNIIDNTPTDIKYAPITNVLDQLKDDFDLLKSEYSKCRAQNDPKLTKGIPLVGHNDYAKYLKTHYDDPIIHENIEKWCADPEYQHLMTLPSIDRLSIKKHYPDIGKRICQVLDRDYDYSVINFQVQPPGYVSPLHVDTKKTLNINEKRTFDIKDQMDYGRFLIFFDDWQSGQVVQMNNQFIQWKAGDVYTWDLRDVPHALANIGYYYRYLILLFAGPSKN
jgi:hypothetical protein